MSRRSIELGEYTSYQLERELRHHGALASMGSVADYDNALAESLFATIECELFDPQPRGRFETRREAKLAVFDYLGTFYNPRRRRSSLGQISPGLVELVVENSQSRLALRPFLQTVNCDRSRARDSVRFLGARTPFWHLFDDLHRGTSKSQLVVGPKCSEELLEVASSHVASVVEGCVMNRVSRNERVAAQD